MSSSSDPKSNVARALELIEAEKRDRTGVLDLGNLGLTEVPDALFVQARGWFGPTNPLRHLRVLNLGTQFPDESAEGGVRTTANSGPPNRLAELPDNTTLWERLPSLQRLSVRGNPSLDRLPPSLPKGLVTLDLSETAVADLAPVRRLTALRALHCGGSFHNRGQVADLAPLHALTALQHLDCRYTQVADLAPLHALHALQHLDCYNTPVADLAPLHALPALQHLNCSFTPVADLAPLHALPALQHLDCSGTPVADLAPLHALHALQHLDCRETQVADLPVSVVFGASLRELRVSNVPHLPIPAEVLSQGFRDNCLERVRAHLRDLGGNRSPPVPVQDIRVVFLGNGRVGKTQLANRLRGVAFDPHSTSTHGVFVTTATFPDALGDADFVLNLWDFGGQDLYHGTHALFVRSRAVFVVVWDAETEAKEHHAHGGYRSENHPLSYWLAYVRHLGHPYARVLLVQNKIDRDGTQPAPLDPTLRETFGDRLAVLSTSAQTGDLDVFRRELLDALRFARAREGAVMGAARAHVIAQLRALRTADQDRPPADREHRILSLEAFEQMCDDARAAKKAPISNSKAFLETLHHAGLIYRREGLFDGQLVLDQTWALDAIYAVFDRDSQAAQVIVASEGRFTPRLLAKTVWRDTHYTQADRAAFLKMMVDSRVCFRLDRRSGQPVLKATSDREARRTSDPEEARYLAPELLPPFETSSVVLRGLWDEAVATEVRALSVPFFGPHLGRLVLSRLGEEVGDHGHYWKFGLYFFDARTQSKALVRCEPQVDDPGNHAGRIEVRAQLGRAGELADQVLGILEDALERAGEVGWHRDGGASGPPRTRGRDPDDESKPPPLTPGRAPNDPVRVYLSYRHTPRSRAVAESVEAALQTVPGLEVHRDVRDLRAGDDLRRYAVAIARADYVVAIVSRRYFDSEHCMRELLFFERDGCADHPDAFRSKLIPVVIEPRPEHDEGLDPTDGTLVAAIRELWTAQLAVQAPESLAEEEFGAIRRRVGPWLDRIARTVTIRDTAEEEAAGWPQVRAWVAR